MSNLVLITSEFPYFSGEPFLLNELPYLSLTFDEIYIFSINARKTDKITRNIPNNARCFPLGNVTSKSKYVKYIFSGIKRPDSDLRITQKKPEKVVASLYARGRAADIANQIYSIIQNNKLNVDDAAIYSFWFAYQAIAAWLLSKKLNEKACNTMCFSRAHGYDLYWERATGGYLPFQDATLKNLNMCFPCSDYGTKYLLKMYPWAENKVMTSRLGTRDYGLNPFKAEKTFVTCCNLEALKRMTLFAEAFCEIAKEDRTIKWICIGSGEEETNIRQIVNKAGVSAQVEMKGRLGNEEVMSLYQTVGVMYFCNVSTTEGLPVSVMEAMSFGIPVIATDVGGTSELVDEINGKLISPNLTKDKLLGILKKALSEDNDCYMSYRNNSRLKWEKLVSADTNYREFCSVISKR